MKNSIVYIHTTHTIIDYITLLSRREMPDRKILHILDESILYDIKEGDIISATSKLQSIIEGAQHSGARQFMITCTSTGRLIDNLGSVIQSQITRIEDAAIAEIKSRTGRIGIVYTNPTVLPEIKYLLHNSGVDANRLAPCFVDGAFESILCGNMAYHDKLIWSYIQTCSGKYDSFLLAQVSICSAQERLEQTVNNKQIISIAELGISKLKEK